MRSGRGCPGHRFSATLLRKLLSGAFGLHGSCEGWVGLTWVVPLRLCSCLSAAPCGPCRVPCLALALCVLGWGPWVLSL